MARTIRTIWFQGWLALAMMFGLCVPARATTLPLPTCILPAQPAFSPRMLFADPGRFDCRASQTRYGSGDFWLISTRIPAAIARGDALTVRFGSAWQDRTTLYVLYADGVIGRVGYTARTASRYLRLGATMSVPLPAHAAPPIRLLWHFEGAANLRGVLLGPALADRTANRVRETVLAGVCGVFAGMALALFVYNLALWGALRQAFQPAYCLLVLCLLAYTISSSGALGEMLPALDNNDRLRINAVTLALSAVSVLTFARAFFEPRVFAGWLNAASNVVAVAILASAALFAAFAPWHIWLLDRLLSCAYVLLLALVPLTLARAWRQRSSYLWLFAIAWGAPIGFAGLRIANALDLVPWSFWLDHSTVVSMMLEATLSSLAVAYRIYLLSRERDAARAQESVARHLADVDPLTGLLNRRAFLTRAIGRPGEQLLLLADIDHFKAVNEAIGHDGGDEVLRVFARVLRASVPAGAIVARIGGEEFAILADGSAALTPDAILARLRSERMPFGRTVTASIGGCAGPIGTENDWSALYRSADAALFEAKGAGRDRARSALPIAA